jgi:cell division protein FtsB
MGALTIIQGGSLPPARARLVALNEKIVAAEKQLRTLRAGEAALASELGRAAEAKAELQDLVNADAVRLVDRLRNGGQWMLSAFGNSRAKELSASLSESRIQGAVGEKALASIGEEIAILEREIADLKAQKQDAVRGVLIEAAGGGARYDLMTAIDHLREAMCVLVALDRATAHSDGSWMPNDRVTVEVPELGGLPAQVIAVPSAAGLGRRNAVPARQSERGRRAD